MSPRHLESGSGRKSAGESLETSEYNLVAAQSLFSSSISVFSISKICLLDMRILESELYFENELRLRLDILRLS